jgi:hypothetical protein
VNDVRAMHAMLSEHFGFDEFTILIDTDPSSEQPTGANIKVRRGGEEGRGWGDGGGGGGGAPH